MTTEPGEIGTLHDSVKRQIDRAGIDGDRPLIICDVDEVVVHFVRSLESHLDANGYWLDTSSFALNGNVRAHGSNEPATTARLGELLLGCFEEQTRVMDAIDGAVEALVALDDHCEIVMLTNMPGTYLDDRIANLRDHGLDFPVIANTGAKGPATHALTVGVEHPAVFIDDSPTNIVSVGETCPDVHLVHFIPDARFGRHVGEIDGVGLRTDNWAETHAFIRDVTGAPPPR